MSPVRPSFWANVSVGDACWEWTAGRTSAGYGMAWTPRQGYAHRLAYEAMVGPIPNGLTIDHLCRNRACVRPSHLEPVTSAENVKRAALARTHCIRGHEWTPESTYWRKNGSRLCRTCTLAAQRAAYAAKKTMSL